MSVGESKGVETFAAASVKGWPVCFVGKHLVIADKGIKIA